MRILQFCLLIAGVYAYVDVDNKFNYEVVAKNATELLHHLNCFLDKETCSDLALHYKSHILDSIITDCASCTAQHKHNGKWFLKGIKEKYPDGYKEFRQRYDPDNKYFDIIERDVEKY